MTDYDYSWSPSKPPLEVIYLQTVLVSQCYRISYYKITSRFNVPDQVIFDLQKYGIISSGQTTSIKKVRKTEMVPCVVRDRRTQKILNIPAINPYSGKEYPDHEMEYFELSIEVHCDSGD